MSTVRVAFHGASAGGDETPRVQYDGDAEDVRGEALIRKITSSFVSVCSALSQQQTATADIERGDESPYAAPRTAAAPDVTGDEETLLTEKTIETVVPRIVKVYEESGSEITGRDDDADVREAGAPPLEAGMVEGPTEESHGQTASIVTATRLQEATSGVMTYAPFVAETQRRTSRGENGLESVITAPSHDVAAQQSAPTHPRSANYSGEEQHKATQAQPLGESRVASYEMYGASVKGADRSDGVQWSAPSASLSSSVSESSEGGELAALPADRDNVIRQTEPKMFGTDEAAGSEEATTSEKNVNAGVPRVVTRPGESDIVTPEQSRKAERSEQPSPPFGVAMPEVSAQTPLTSEGSRANHAPSPNAAAEPLHNVPRIAPDFTVLKSSDTSLEVRFAVEGIGDVDVEVVLDHGMITGKVSTSDLTGKEFIERNLSQLLDALSREGLNIGGFSVSLRHGRNMTGAQPYAHGAAAQVETEPVATIHRPIGHTISLFV